MKSHVLSFALLSAITIVAGTSANAQNGSLTRSFVSSSGVDTNPCTITQPCATFAHAYTMIAANGIVAALDPGKYGPLTITGPVTIDGNGWAAVTAPAGGIGIAVNTAINSGDTVILTGLKIDGAGAGGTTGISINVSGGGTVVIESSRIAGGSPAILFQAGDSLFLRNVETIGGGNGIQHNASGGMLTLTDSVLRGASNCFIAQVETSSAPAYATIINSRAEGCNMGFLAYANSVVSISNSSAVGSALSSNICYAAFIATGDSSGPGKLNLDNVVATTCFYGVTAAPYVSGGTGTITMSNSLVTANNTGVSPFGTIYTLGNNRVYGNTTNDNGQPTSAPSNWIQ